MTIVCLIAAVLTLGFKFQPTLFHNTIGYLVAPLQNGVTGIASWADDKFSFLFNSDGIKNENEKLKEEIEDLRLQNSRLKQTEEELEELRALYRLEEKYQDYPKIGARIIAKDVSNWQHIYIIDKGQNDGLEKNMVVLASGGLAGRILETGPNYSKIMAIIDDTSSVSAKSARTEDVGFVKGDQQLSSSGLCKMEYIDANAEMIEGDEIITSQLSEFYPTGLTIGTVKEIRTDQSGLNKYAIIQPAVDFKNLETVLVINRNFHEEYLDTLGDAYVGTQEE